MRRASALFVLAWLLSACGGTPFQSAPTPTTAWVNGDPRCKGLAILPERTIGHLAFYRWRKSANGYVAEPTGLDGSLATRAQFNTTPYPNPQAVLVTFNARGRQLLHQLTGELAQPPTASNDSPENHLPTLLGLTDYQRAHWADPAVQKPALRPLDQGGNLLDDPVVIGAAFAGGEVLANLAGDLTTTCSLTATAR